MSSHHVQQVNANFAKAEASLNMLPRPLPGSVRPTKEVRSQFHIYRTECVNLTSTLSGGGDWHWRLTGSSGATIADCGGYRNEAQCLAAVDALRFDAADAKLVQHGELTDFSLKASRA